MCIATGNYNPYIVVNSWELQPLSKLLMDHSPLLYGLEEYDPLACLRFLHNPKGLCNQSMTDGWLRWLRDLKDLTLHLICDGGISHLAFEPHHTSSHSVGEALNGVSFITQKWWCQARDVAADVEIWEQVWESINSSTWGGQPTCPIKPVLLLSACYRKHENRAYDPRIREAEHGTWNIHST